MPDSASSSFQHLPASRRRSSSSTNDQQGNSTNNCDFEFLVFGASSLHNYWVYFCWQ